MIKNTIVLILIILSFSINLISLSENKSEFSFIKNLPFRSFGLSQKWSLFAPNPNFINLKTLIVGETEEGLFYNLKTQTPYDGKTELVPNSAPIGYNHHSHNLGILSTFLGVSSYHTFGKSLCYDVAQFYINEWTKKYSSKIVRVHFVQSAIKTISPNSYSPVELNTIFVLNL